MSHCQEPEAGILCNKKTHFKVSSKEIAKLYFCRECLFQTFSTINEYVLSVVDLETEETYSSTQFNTKFKKEIKKFTTSVTEQ